MESGHTFLHFFLEPFPKLINGVKREQFCIGRKGGKCIVYQIVTVSEIGGYRFFVPTDHPGP
jgi:hypothetical protein